MMMVCNEYNDDDDDDDDDVDDDDDDDGYDDDDDGDYAIRPLDVTMTTIHMMNDMLVNEWRRQPLRNNARR